MEAAQRAFRSECRASAKRDLENIPSPLALNRIDPPCTGLIASRDEQSEMPGGESADHRDRKQDEGFLDDGAYVM